MSTALPFSKANLASRLTEPVTLRQSGALNCADLLRLYDEFDSAPYNQSPKFQYDFSHPELQRLRESHKLDQIAGTGDEFSKAIRLIEWMKEHIAYKADVASALPEVVKRLPMNAKALIEYSFDKGQSAGINCYMHAILLAEACLSVGLKCRIVSLNPLNPFDYDNHLLNVVWSSGRSKWVMVDSSYNAFVSDENGQVLDLWEIRDLLSRQRNLVCNTS